MHPAGDCDVWLWDAELKGFGLRVRSKGRKVYVLEYRPGVGGKKRVVDVAPRDLLKIHGEMAGTPYQASRLGSRWRRGGYSAVGQAAGNPRRV